MINEIKEVNGMGITKNLIGINYTKGMFIKPKFIVVHDISNPKFETMREFRNYIAHEKEAKMSVHYLVGARAIVKTLEDDWRGWHVGDKATKDITNSNSISVAMFIRESKDIGRVINNTIELINKLREKYDIPIKNVKRHFDVTGRQCPKILLQEDNWNRFILALKGVHEDLNLIGKGKIIGVLSKLNLKKEPNDDSEILGEISSKSDFPIYKKRGNWYKTSIEDDDRILIGYLNKDYVEFIPIEERKEESINSDLEDESIKDNIRVETKEVILEEAIIINKIEPAIEETVKKVKNLDRDSEIKKEVLKVNEDISKPKVEVLPTMIIAIDRYGIVVNVETNLNVRRGPGNENYVVGYLLAGQKIYIDHEIGEWYKIVYQSTIGKRNGYVEKEFIKIT